MIIFEFKRFKLMFYRHKQPSRAPIAPLEPIVTMCFITIALKLSMAHGALMVVGHAG
jgi:hypothetical protein